MIQVNPRHSYLNSLIFEHCLLWALTCFRGRGPSMALPRISVVIPANNAAQTLAQCLQALAQSEIAPFECLVVDDASTDGTPEIARRLGARVLTIRRRQGPARARNRGARVANGDIIFFIDSDVCVRRDTLSRLTAKFEKETGIDAIIGSYDDSPQAEDVLSMYRNLLHRYVHQSSRPEATTFWSGCGAIRRQVFLDYGGFDEAYSRPAVEDIELGLRLTAGGNRIFLDHDLEVKHLKLWCFLNLVKTDICDRGIPWTELILRDGRMINDLNLRVGHRVSVGLAVLAVAFAMAAVFLCGGLFVAPLLAAVVMALTGYSVGSGPPRGNGMNLGLTGLLLAFCWLAYSTHMLVLLPPIALGHLLLLFPTRYGRQTGIYRKAIRLGYSACILASIGLIARALPARLPVVGFCATILALLAINGRFYGYLARRMGWLRTLAALPFHLLFYFYSGAAFIAGLCLYSSRAIVSSQRTVEAPRETG